MRKRGSYAMEQPLELILAIAGAGVLIFLFISLVAPSFNKVDKAADSYFDSLIEKMGEVDFENERSYSFWQDLEGVDFFIVYFGERTVVRDFYSLGNNENHICLCYNEKKEWVCNHCKNLDGPAFISPDTGFIEPGIQGDPYCYGEYYEDFTEGQDSWFVCDARDLIITKSEWGYYFEIQ